MCSENTTSSLHIVPPKRKLSFPASFHSNILGSKTFTDINASSINSSNNNSGNHHLTVTGDFGTSSSRRRFSNVGDAVSRKLSTTIGWKNQQLQTLEIVRDGKALCGQYIRCRLKRCRLFNKKCGLQRLRSAASLPEGYVVREVFPDMLRIGIEMERMHPKLYTDVAKQANGGTYASGIVVTEKIVQNILISVGRSLFCNDAVVTWAKVVSFFAVAGGLAADCVRQQHVEYISVIVETVGLIIDEQLSGWINEVGGWMALQSYCKVDSPKISLTKAYTYIMAMVASVAIVVVLIKWLGLFTRNV